MTKSAATRARILDAALELFRQRGFAETTMREVAASAGVATGASYYYFQSKEDLVMAFYERSAQETEPALQAALGAHSKLEPCLRALVSVKLAYFSPDRKLLRALVGQAADLSNPLSPFGEATRPMREHDQALFARALERAEVPADLAPHMPKLLWLFQMGVIFFWITDESEGQHRTQQVLDRGLRIVTKLLGLSSLPLMRPARKLVLGLIAAVEGRDEPT